MLAVAEKPARRGRPGRLVDGDLDVEERGVPLLFGLGEDADDLAGELGVGQGADLDLGVHPGHDLADVDLVHGALEEEARHVGQRAELGPRLVVGQRHDGVALEDTLGQDDAGVRGPDDGIDVPVGHLDPTLLQELETLGGDLVSEVRFPEGALRGGHLGFGDERSLEELDLALPVRLELAHADLGDFHAPAGLDVFERRRVGRDLEERRPGGHRDRPP